MSAMEMKAFSGSKIEYVKNTYLEISKDCASHGNTPLVYCLQCERAIIKSANKKFAIQEENNLLLTVVNEDPKIMSAHPTLRLIADANVVKLMHHIFMKNDYNKRSTFVTFGMKPKNEVYIRTFFP